MIGSFLKFIDWDTSTQEEQKNILKRPKGSMNLELKNKVSEIISDVKRNGDQALKSFALKYDGVNLSELKVTESEIENAFKKTSLEIIEALKVSIQNISKFHHLQKKEDLKVETMTGVLCEKKTYPIEKVGLYIPGGSAPLPSTLMMLAIPAIIAGCEEIVLITPPQKNGDVHPVVLAAAKLLNIKNIFKSGGAQAIAALAYGTESIPKVDKVFGPGNAWVTECKMQVGFDPEGAAIDLPAGPSEVLVIADESANPIFVASDLLSQAEHDPSSQVVLVTTSKDLIIKVEQQIANQLELNPRKTIAIEALKSSRAILTRDLKTALEVSNLYAPEHLIIQVEDLEYAKSKVKHAGSVFLGPWSPESVGDYSSGTNHVLPTYGFAKAFSGVSLDSFTKSISFQELSQIGLKKLGPSVEVLAEAEGLYAHKQAVSLRLKQIKNEGLC